MPRPAERPARWRAPLAVGLLVAFHVVGAVAVVGLLALAVMSLRSDTVSPVGIVVAVGLAAAIVVGWLPSRQRFDPPVPSIEVDPAAESRLTALVHEVAAAMRAPLPDEVLLTHDANASASVDSRLLGLRVRRRRLTVGLGLLSTASVDEVQALIAHELAHHANGDTRLAHLVYRGQQAIVGTVRAMPEGVLSLPYRGFLELYLRCAGAVSRDQEFAADAWAVKLAGPDATARMLRRAEPTGRALQQFLQQAVHPFWAAGLHPPNLYAGLRASLAADGPWTVDDTPTTTTRRSPYDSHPPTAVRLDRIGASPAGLARLDAAETARTLLADPDATETAMTAALARAAVGGPTTLSSWDDGVPFAFAEHVRAEIRSLMALTGAPDGPAALDHLLALDEQALTALVWKTASSSACSIDEGRRRLTRLTATTLAAGLVKRQGHRWTMRFDEPLGVVDARAHPVEVHRLAAALIGGDTSAASEIARLRAGGSA